MILKLYNEFGSYTVVMINYINFKILKLYTKIMKENNRIIDITGEIEVINKFIQNGDIVFDVGANIGEWTQEVLKTKSNIKIHLFEPVIHTYKNLIDNLSTSHNTENLYFNQIALSNKTEIKSFNYYVKNSGLSTFYRRFNAEKEYNFAPPNTVEVFTKTLDKYCQELGIKRINFLKIDVEGAELDVLLGAKILLEKGDIDYIQFEYGRTYLDAKISLEEVFAYLEKYNYFFCAIQPNNISYIPNFTPKLENFKMQNFLAVNDRLKSLLLNLNPEMLPIDNLLKQYNIQPKGIIHIGAHEGQEVNTYKSWGVDNILYIEANPKVFAKLQKNLVSFPDVKIACCAISNQNGEITLNITSSDQSSSILSLKIHQKIYPTITEEEQIIVPSKTLDFLLKEMALNSTNFNILNIDIQGAELLAFQGSIETLKYIDAINTEVNYQELYEGCALIWELDEFLENHGFKRVLTTTPYHSSWGDAFYVKEKFIPKNLPSQGVITMKNLGKLGRFGNQIFQYGFLKVYAKQHNLKVETPSWIGEYLFGCQDDDISKQLPSFMVEEYDLYKSPIYKRNSTIKNVDLWGFFQCHTSFYAREKDYFISLFQPTLDVEYIVKSAYQKLKNKGKTIIGIHLRQGDSYHSFPIEWYQEWLKNIWNQLENPVLFLASDNLDDILDKFVEYNPITTQDLNCHLAQAPFYPDFYFLTECDILALSHSTFSYSASLLNQQATSFWCPNIRLQKLIKFEPWHTEIASDEMDYFEYDNQIITFGALNSLYKNAQFDRLNQLIEEGIKLKDSNILILKFLGLFLVKDCLTYTEIKKGVELLTEYLEINPEDKSFGVIYASSLWFIGNKQEAINYLTNYLEKNINSLRNRELIARSYKLLGEYWLSEGEVIKALDSFRESLKFDSSMAFWQEKCANLLRQQYSQVLVKDGDISANFSLSGKSDLDFIHIQGIFANLSQCQLIKNQNKPYKNILEYGSYIGNDTIYYLKSLNPINVYCVENNRLYQSILESNLAINDLGDSQVRIFDNVLDVLNLSLESIDLIKIEEIPDNEINFLMDLWETIQKFKPDVFIRLHFNNQNLGLNIINNLGYEIKAEFNDFSAKTYLLSPTKIDSNGNNFIIQQLETKLNIDLEKVNLLFNPNILLSESSIYEDLQQIFEILLQHPQIEHINLLINGYNLNTDDVYLVMMDIVLNILMANNLEIEPNITIIPPLSSIEWKVLLTKIKGIIITANNKEFKVNFSTVNIDDYDIPKINLKSLEKYNI